MREIKFRGKRVDNGEWFYGCLSYVDSRSQKIGCDFGNSFICQVQHSWQKTDNGYNIGWWIQVETKTVGQFTGLRDKNGVEIYENDKVFDGKYYGIIEYRECSFVINWEIDCSHDDDLNYWNDKIEVTGNIHEVKQDEI